MIKVAGVGSNNKILFAPHRPPWIKVIIRFSLNSASGELRKYFGTWLEREFSYFHFWELSGTKPPDTRDYLFPNLTFRINSISLYISLSLSLSHTHIGRCYIGISLCYTNPYLGIGTIIFHGLTYTFKLIFSQNILFARLKIFCILWSTLVEGG